MRILSLGAGAAPTKRHWQLVPNPAWAGRTPFGATESACCPQDRSHCLDVICRCGEYMHLHESQIRDVSHETAIGSRCKGCGEMLLFPPGYVHRAFARMRTDGWIV